MRERERERAREGEREGVRERERERERERDTHTHAERQKERRHLKKEDRGVEGRHAEACDPVVLPTRPEININYRGTSLTRKRTPLGPYRRPMPRVLGGS